MPVLDSFLDSLAAGLLDGSDPFALPNTATGGAPQMPHWLGTDGATAAPVSGSIMTAGMTATPSIKEML